MAYQYVYLRCDLCVHWCNPDDKNQEPNLLGFQQCAAVKHRLPIEEHAVILEPWPGGPHLKFYEDENGDTVTDDEAYNAYDKKRTDALKKERAYMEDPAYIDATLYTSPDFFCAKFTPRKVTTDAH